MNDHDRLDVIESNWDSMLWPPYGARAEVAYLLNLARKQQAALDAVRNVHAPRKFDPVTDGVYFGQTNMDYEVCHHDAELYPCRTISAVEAKP